MSSEYREELLRELGETVQAYQAAVHDFDAAAAAALGVNGTDLRCLEILHGQDFALPSELGNDLGLTTGSVTTMLDRLARKGYVTRRADPSDRRKVIVRMTAKARRRVWDRIYRPLVDEGFASIADLSDAQLKAAAEYLRRGRELHERHLRRIRGDRTP